MKRLGKVWVAGFTGLLGIGLCSGAPAEPPDSELNPVSGKIESVYMSWGGSDWKVLHVTDSGPGGEVVVTVLEDTPLNGLSPRIAIRPDGSAGVVYWSDGQVNEVLFTNRDPATEQWTPATRISMEGTSSSHPALVTDGTRFWAAFEFDAPGGETGIAATSITDVPEPYPTLVGTTTFEGAVDVEVHSQSGQVWVTWVDSATDVGWSAHDPASETWSVPQYESYAADDVPSARSRIRSRVIGE